MPVYLLTEDPELFPPVDETEPHGLLAVGGDLSPARLLAAYRRGIFPWYSEGQPILWHCPNPRFVLVPSQLHLPKSLKKTLKRGHYQVRYDTAFEKVLDGCAATVRPGQSGTWITDEMRQAYVELHRRGHVHSVEAWEGEELMGGLYGVALGSVFFGESMFARGPDASKVAFATVCEDLIRWGYGLIDCQQETEHLARFGAESWPRRKFLSALAAGLRQPASPEAWRR